MLNRPSISLADAEQIVAAAKRIAAPLGFPVSIVVVDSTTYLQHAVRQDGAPLMSLEGAHDKARTAAEGGHPTTFFEKQAVEGRISILRMPVTCVEGGIPIFVKGQCVGGVGVAGAPPHLDTQIAEGAIASFVDGLKDAP